MLLHSTARTGFGHGFGEFIVNFHERFGAPGSEMAKMSLVCLCLRMFLCTCVCRACACVPVYMRLCPWFESRLPGGVFGGRSDRVRAGARSVLRVHSTDGVDD